MRIDVSASVDNLHNVCDGNSIDTGNDAVRIDDQHFLGPILSQAPHFEVAHRP